MKKEEIQQVINNILSIIDVMISSSSQFLTSYEKDDENGQMYYNDIIAGINCLKGNYPQIEKELEHAYYIQMVHNVEDTLERLAEEINADEREKALSLFEYQLQPFLLEMKEELYFWSMVYPNKAKMADYYEKDFIPNHSNPYVKGRELPFEIAIFIPVYNKLEYTKRCIESIKKYTDLERHRSEFILINDGSSDGTEEYFKSLGIQKVINFKENVKASIFTTAFRVCEAKYFLFVNNDTVVTDGWLDNLIVCMESDDKIVSATPCTPNTSNLQGDFRNMFPTELSGLENFRNASSPEYWEERCRVMPVIALYRSSILNEIGFADRLYYTLEYWDDDFSLRARRAGYRQILCKDTYCYHFGSVTGADDQSKKGTIELGKELFFHKNGVAAWSVGFGYDYFTMKLIEKNPVKQSKRMKILGIDCGFGDMLLKLRDYFRKSGNVVEVDSLTLDDRYLPDLRPISDRSMCPHSLGEGLEALEEDSYDCVYVSECLQTYERIGDFISSVRRLLKKEGVLVFSIRNVVYEPNLSLCGQGMFPWIGESVSFINPVFLQQQIEQMFTEHKCIPVWGHDIGKKLEGQIFGAEYLIYYCTK